MSQSESNDVVGVARDYYNSDDADSFYATVWGGEDIHIGLYRDEQESIATASRRTVEQMAERLGQITPAMRVLDLGAGYGGTARYLAERFGCHVTCLNLSEVQNERNRRMNREQGLDEKIRVVDGNFEQVDEPDASFDIIWSQDAFLHSGRRDTIIGEIARLLKPGGQAIFTDPMQSDDCPEGVLGPVLARIHLDSMGSPGFYRQSAQRHGLEPIGWDDHSQQLTTHYSRVRDEIIQRHDELRTVCSEAYIERMKAGLQHWVDAGRSGYLCWGILQLKKP